MAHPQPHPHPHASLLPWPRTHLGAPPPRPLLSSRLQGEKGLRCCRKDPCYSPSREHPTDMGSIPDSPLPCWGRRHPQAGPAGHKVPWSPGLTVPSTAVMMLSGTQPAPWRLCATITSVPCAQGQPLLLPAPHQPHCGCVSSVCGRAGGCKPPPEHQQHSTGRMLSLWRSSILLPPSLEVPPGWKPLAESMGHPNTGMSP